MDNKCLKFNEILKVINDGKFNLKKTLINEYKNDDKKINVPSLFEIRDALAKLKKRT